MHFFKGCLPAAAIAVITACSAAPQAAAENDAARTIIVTGQGEASAAPDMVVLSIGVETQGDTAAAALRENSAAMSATIEKLKDLGVADKDIQTSGLSINPRYDYERSRTNPPIAGYVASNTVTARLRDLASAGAVIDQAVESGANRLNGISFTFADPKPLYDEARRDAVAQAKAKAELLTDAAGVSLGRLLTIQDGAYRAPSPLKMTAAFAEADARAVPIAAGESTLRASVTLIYEIR